MADRRRTGADASTSGGSDDDDDANSSDEDDETARRAAVTNQIKTSLTNILLEVTDALFGECMPPIGSPLHCPAYCCVLCVNCL